MSQTNQPIDPSQSTVDYFRWKSQSISPSGNTIDLTPTPLIDEGKPSTIYDYATQQTYDRSYLTNLGRDPIDGINTVLDRVGNAYQSDLDALLEKMLTYNGTPRSRTIYSSLLWTGQRAEELNDYMKIILKKPSSEVTENLAARRRQRVSTNTGRTVNSVIQENVPFLGALGATAQILSLNQLDLPNLGSQVSNTINSVEKVSNGIIDSIENNFSEFSEDQVKEIYGSDGVVEIFLPLPKQILEQYSHLIDNAELGSVAQLKAGFSMVQGAAMFAGGALSSVTPTAGLTALLNPANIPGLQSFISGVVGSLDFVSASQRKALNPVQEALYRTPQARNFQWTFEIMPTNQIQAKAISEIIQALKEHSSPINMGDILYDFPGFIEFEFYINNELAIFLPRSLYATEDKLKVPSLISNIQVDYTSSGMYSHFVDNYPTNYSITLEFVESQPLDRNIIMTDYTIITGQNIETTLNSSVRLIDQR